MWCSREMIINMKSKLDIKQHEAYVDSMRIECIIVLSLAQKPTIKTFSCLCRGFVPYLQAEEHCVSCWGLPHGTGPTAVLHTSLAGSLHLVCLAFIPRESEVGGWERGHCVPLQGGFQPGCSHGAGVQTRPWAWTDTPARIRLLPAPTLYFVSLKNFGEQSW